VSISVLTFPLSRHQRRVGRGGDRGFVGDGFVGEERVEIVTALCLNFGEELRDECERRTDAVSPSSLTDVIGPPFAT
jgi:hypothetical protein